MEQSVRVCVCVSVWCNHNNATVFITKIIGFGWRLNFRDACSHQKCQPNYRIFHFFLCVFFGWERLTHYVSMFAAFVSLQMTIHFLLPHSLLRFKSMASIINLFALHDSWTGEQFVTNSAKSSIGNLNKHWSWLIVFQKNRAILFLIGRIYFCRWWLLKIKPIHHSHQHKCYGTLTHTRARAFTPVVNAV